MKPFLFTAIAAWIALAQPGAVRADMEGHFQVAWDVGTLSCVGRVSGGKGSGTCKFAADPKFSEILQLKGFRTPSEVDLLTCWVQGVSRSSCAECCRVPGPVPATDK